MLVTKFGEYSKYINISFAVASYLMSIYILTLRSGTLDIKLPWVVLILVFPAVGMIAYLLFNEQRLRKKLLNRLEKKTYEQNDFAPIDNVIYDKLLIENKRVFQQSNYINNVYGLPAFINTSTEYFEIGEKYFEALVEELKKAKDFIFMEYFIIDDGRMWDTILEILKEKASQGVEVRLMYDDGGTLTTLPYKYYKELEKYNIHAVAFNPFTPIVSFRHNIRDHRKIVVIDGKVGFTGGINLADEYINEKLRFGHWKDTGIMIKGDAVKSLTIMFLELWHLYKNRDEKCDKYFASENVTNDGYVQPYEDAPVDDELVARNVYINILNDATDYVYITTPYLILDPELTNSIVSASRRGVDVRIITPHIPDKWYVHFVTQSHYMPLLKVGVKIYEYTPGFIHAKNVVCDDMIATVGTINFDYRSLYHNYECGVWMYNTSAVNNMKKDFENTLEISQEITKEYVEKFNIFKKIISGVLKFFSPLF